jgi:hypothetical protein
MLLSRAEDLGAPGRDNSYGYDQVIVLETVRYLIEKNGEHQPQPPLQHLDGPSTK